MMMREMLVVLVVAGLAAALDARFFTKDFNTVKTHIRFYRIKQLSNFKIIL